MPTSCQCLHAVFMLVFSVSSRLGMSLLVYIGKNKSCLDMLARDNVELTGCKRYLKPTSPSSQGWSANSC